jgi:hypothetical protein
MKQPVLQFLIYGLVAGCLVTLTGCATNSNQSGSTGAAAPDRFAKADTNHDGKLSQTEASDYFVTIIFESRDLNHDGKVTWEEWHVPGAKDNKARFDSADTNKDGSLTLEEALVFGREQGLYKKQFEQADTNHDGYVTREEAVAYSGKVQGPAE